MFLSAIASSNAFWELYEALICPATKQINLYSEADTDTPTPLATAFELVAVASIEDIKFGCHANIPGDSVLHDPNARNERERRWAAIKSYFRHANVRRHDHNDVHWFTALDGLLDVTWNRRIQTSRNDVETAELIKNICEEASELVDSCMVDEVLKEINIPQKCKTLIRYLESRNSPGRREGYRADHDYLQLTVSR